MWHTQYLSTDLCFSFSIPFLSSPPSLRPNTSLQLCFGKKKANLLQPLYTYDCPDFLKMRPGSRRDNLVHVLCFQQQSAEAQKTKPIHKTAKSVHKTTKHQLQDKQPFKTTATNIFHSIMLKHTLLKAIHL